MKKIILTFLVLTIFHLPIYSQNKVEKSKKELQNNPKQKSSNNTNSSTNSTNCVFCEIAFDVLIYTTYGVFKYGIIGDYNNENHLFNSLSNFPYQNGPYGNYEINDQQSKNIMRLDIENKFLYSNNKLFGNHIKLKFRPFHFFYLQGDYHELREIDRIKNEHYNLSIYQFNLCYDRIRFEKFNMGWNIGYTYISNEVKKGGLAYGLNMDYFLNNRISFYGSAKWAKINSQPINTFELQTRIHKKNYFFTLGLENLKIATPTYNFVTLGGGIYL